MLLYHFDRSGCLLSHGLFDSIVFRVQYTPYGLSKYAKSENRESSENAPLWSTWYSTTIGSGPAGFGLLYLYS